MSLVQQHLGKRHILAGIIWSAGTAAHHQVPVGVALGLGDNHLSVAVDAQKRMRIRCRLDRVHRHGEIAVGGVLEPDRHRQAAGHLPVGLGLGGAGPDRRPTDQVG